MSRYSWAQGVGGAGKVPSWTAPRLFLSWKKLPGVCHWGCSLAFGAATAAPPCPVRPCVPAMCSLPTMDCACVTPCPWGPPSPCQYPELTQGPYCQGNMRASLLLPLPGTPQPLFSYLLRCLLLAEHPPGHPDTCLVSAQATSPLCKPAESGPVIGGTPAGAGREQGPSTWARCGRRR